MIEQVLLAPAAVGQVTIADDAVCSGVVVAPDVVDRAANCLFEDDHSPSTGQVGFHLASLGSAEVLDVDVARVEIMAGFDAKTFAEGPEVDTFDVVLLVLERPLEGVTPVAVRAFAEIPETPAPYLVHAGFGDDAPGLLSATFGCTVTSVFDDQTFSHDCYTGEGDSGSPILWIDGDEVALIGIESSSYEDETEGDWFNVAVASDAFLEPLQRLLDLRPSLPTD